MKGSGDLHVELPLQHIHAKNGEEPVAKQSVF